MNIVLRAAIDAVNTVDSMLVVLSEAADSGCVVFNFLRNLVSLCLIL